MWVSNVPAVQDDYHWTQTLQDTIDIKSMDTDNQFNLFIAGNVMSGDSDIIIAKYDYQGVVQWKKIVGGTYDDVAFSIDVNNSKELVVGGFIGGNAILNDDDILVSTDQPEDQIKYNGFIMKLDSTNGRCLWFKTVKQTIVSCVSFAKNKEIFYCGAFQSGSEDLCELDPFNWFCNKRQIYTPTIDFNPSDGMEDIHKSENFYPQMNDNGQAKGTHFLPDIFISHLSNDGAYKGTKTYGELNKGFVPISMKFFNDRIYLSGAFMDIQTQATQSFLIQTSMNCDEMFSRTPFVWKSTDNIQSAPIDMVIDEQGNIFLASIENFENSISELYYGNIILPEIRSNTDDVLKGVITRINTAGQATQLYHCSADVELSFLSLASSPDHHLYVTGFFEGNADFDQSDFITAGNRTSSGDDDIFLLKISNKGAFQWIKKLGAYSGISRGQRLIMKGSSLWTSGIFSSGFNFAQAFESYDYHTCQSEFCAYVLKLNDNHPPAFTVSLPEMLTLVEDDSKSLEIAISDADADSLTLEFYSSNTTLLPDDQLIFSNNTLSIQPTSNEFGESLVSVALSDGSVEILERINVIVQPVNDPPSFTKGSNQRVDEDCGVQTVSWTGHMSTGPLNESDQTISFIVRHIDNPSILSGMPVISSNGELTYTPAENAYGQASITIHAQDDGGLLNNGNDTSASQEFIIYIDPINDCPSFSKGDDLVVSNYSGKQIISNWAANIHPGYFEDNQTVDFSVTSNNTVLFTDLPIIRPDGTLEFTPNSNATGIAEVTVSAHDNGGLDKNGCNTSSQQTFTITVEPTYYTLCLEMTGQGSVQMETDHSSNVVLPEWCGQFLANETIQLIARPETNWNFVSWSNGLSCTATEIQYQITENTTIQVNYHIKQVILSLEGNTSIKVNHVLNNLPVTLPFDLNSNVFLEIVDPDNFICWAGDMDQDCAQSISINMSKDKTIAPLYANPFEWRAGIKGISDADGKTCRSELLIGTSIIERTQVEDRIDEYPCRMFIHIPEINDRHSVYVQKNDRRLYQWNILVNPHDSTIDPKSNTVNILWDPTQLSSLGHYYMLIGFESTGEIIISDMRQSSELSVTGADAMQYYSIIWALDYAVSKIHLKTGWNLASLPFQSDTGFPLADYFPEAQTAYIFNNGSYIQTNNIPPGKGFWIKIPEDKTYIFMGEPLNSYTETFSEGWHMVGSSFHSSQPVTEPEDCIQAIFVYKEGSYQQATRLEPGLGYWVKIREECISRVGSN
jgi:hypothetical protein